MRAPCQPYVSESTVLLTRFSPISSCAAALVTVGQVLIPRRSFAVGPSDDRCGIALLRCARREAPSIMSLYKNDHLFGDVCQYKGRLGVAVRCRVHTLGNLRHDG